MGSFVCAGSNSHRVRLRFKLPELEDEFQKSTSTFKLYKREGLRRGEQKHFTGE